MMWPRKHLQDCLEAYPDGTDVPLDNWRQLNKHVHTLIGISGYQRARIQARHRALLQRSFTACASGCC
jgi:hypothetical protein